MIRNAALFLTGAALATVGLRKGSFAGLTLLLTGAGLAAGALARTGQEIARRTQQVASPEPGQLEEPKDRVDEASDQSFPASDPPAFANGSAG